MMGRGPAPRDHSLFEERQWDKLSAATLDLCYLFERGYAEAAALELVGNRYQLRERQRLAVLRCAAGPTEVQARAARAVELMPGLTLDIDGFNLVILLEAAKGGGLLLRGADGCLRDLSSVHGNYRLVSQTATVLEQLGCWLASQQVTRARWWFDAPVSNSGRLVVLVRELAQKHGWKWEAQTAYHVDQIIASTKAVAVSSDKIILQTCERWTNLGHAAVTALYPDAWIVPLPNDEDLDRSKRLFLFGGDVHKSDV